MQNCRQRNDYQRSHSQTMAPNEYRQKSSGRSNKDPYTHSVSNNINSHKSLPDLHTQISRHSPHSEALSSCSRGNRSNRSGGSSGFNRDRDSGGSSGQILIQFSFINNTKIHLILGHFTQRSEPCCKQM